MGIITQYSNTEEYQEAPQLEQPEHGIEFQNKNERSLKPRCIVFENKWTRLIFGSV